ncbi:putative DNA helicase UvrD/REP type [Klebsormidium nitens]|uniref:DNA 3'-5' helicase n=1 Tax=Klebsormidium nitens TaxID=105231 RepID=A0A1Y1IEB8_KLENI|nr:putative DNA helicase UvrD/REP type [Klebsormidium nitens]|eukprot:GAQ89294.1 putative DNA helicase UvrD/REP type [Klebsormidium nitens]
MIPGGGAMPGQAGFGPELSEAQKMAAFAPLDKPLLIVAAAGSGKTSVLCHRILHMIAQGIEPGSVLAVTFTRRAGQDLLRRIRALAQLPGLGPAHATACERVRVGTFHSFCLSVLRKHPEKAGLARNFAVYTPKMQRDLLLGLVHEYYIGMGMIQQRRQGRPIPQELHSSAALVRSLPPEQRAQFQAEAARLLRKISRLQADAGAGSSQSILGDGTDNEMFSWIYDHYKQRLREVNGVDFNGFIRHTVKLFQSCPEVLQQQRGQSRYVLVDEFQDTDTCQFELLRLLCAPAPGDSGRVTVVGDDDQQIYTWRGAAGLRNFAAFDEAFPDAKTVLLEQNFRCSAAIVSASRMVISRNTRRRAKSIRPVAPFGVAVTVSECRNEACEATEVAEAIHELVAAQGLVLSEIVVLYRLQRVGLDVMQGLRARGIACHFKGSGSGGGGGEEGFGFGASGGGSAFEDVLAVLALVVNEGNDAACAQLLHTCSQHVAAPDGAALACVSLLNHEKGIPLLAAIKSVRAHALGVMPCAELREFAPAQSLDATSATIGAMLAVLRIVAAAKQEAQQLGCKDLVLNVLKQVAPYHGSEAQDGEEVPTQGTRTGKSSQPGKGNGVKGSFAFAGIKALIREAELFEEAESSRVPETPSALKPPLSQAEGAALDGTYTTGGMTSARNVGTVIQDGSPLRREGVSLRPEQVPCQPLGRDNGAEASTSGRGQDPQLSGGQNGCVKTPLQGREQREGWLTPPPSRGLSNLDNTPLRMGSQGSGQQSSHLRTSASRGGHTSPRFAGCGPAREGSYADLMAKRGRRSTPAQLSSALRSVPPVPRPNLCLTPGTTPSTAPRAESPLRNPAKETSATGVESGGFSFAVTPCEDSRSPTLFKAPGASRPAEGSPASTPVANPRTHPHPSYAPSSQSGKTAKRIGATEAARIARLQKFVDRVMLRSEEQELGEAGDLGAGPEEKDGEEEEAVTLTTIHQAKGLEWTAVILVRAIEGVLPLSDHSYTSARETRTVVVRDQGHMPPSASNAQLGDGPSVTAADTVDNVAALGAVRREGGDDEPEALEEERRLLYVALTRAKRFFMVTHVMSDGGQQRSPSRFLQDIPRGLTRRTQRYDVGPPPQALTPSQSQAAGPSQMGPGRPSPGTSKRGGSSLAKTGRAEKSRGRKGGDQGGVKKGRGRKEGEDKENAGEGKKRNGRKRNAKKVVDEEVTADCDVGTSDAEKDAEIDEPLARRRQVKRRPLRVVED